MNEIKSKFEERIYHRSNSIVFKKTKEDFGGLSNMAGGFPLIINGINFRTSEALYQACRFPHMPQVQELIINEVSPMTAKMRSKPFKQYSREDWLDVRIPVMRWCLRVKLLQNINHFYPLLLSTKDKIIVEESHKDSFWGAKPLDENLLKGVNALGRLLMELRLEFLDISNGVYTLKPPPIENFFMLGQPIDCIQINWYFNKSLNKRTNTIDDQISFDEL